MAWELVKTLSDATGTVRGAWLDDNYVYVGSDDSNIYIYNKSDFSLETTLSDSESVIYEVFADQDYLYVGESGNPPYIYVYNKSNFSLEATLKDESAPGVVVHSIRTDSNYIYAAVDYRSARVYNKSDFSLETTLSTGTQSARYAPYGIYIDSGYIYIGCYIGRIFVYNKADFSRSALLSDAAKTVNSVFADENYLYASSRDGNTYIYNKSDFSLNTTLTNSAQGEIYSMFVDDDYLYTGSNKGTCIYNKSDFSLETTLSDSESVIYEVFADQDYLYTLCGNNVYIYQLPISYQYAYGDILSAATESIIEGSVNFFGSATMSVNAKVVSVVESSADFIGEAVMSVNAQIINNANVSASFEGTATMSINPVRIGISSVDILGESTMNITPHIIANASTNMLGEALMYVRALRLIIPEGAYEITANDYFTKNQPADSSSVANYIIVETQPLVPGEVEELFSTNDPRTIGAGETIVINAEYSSKPAIEVSASLEDNTANTKIAKANFYACSAEIEITNEGTGQDSFNLSINGTVLEVSGVEKAYSQDDRSITENGEITYELPENHLIQTKEMAQTIASKLKDSFADPRRDVSLDWRGNPALILADSVTVPEFQKLGINKIGSFYVTKQELEYDRGLRADLEGRKNE